MSQVMVMNPKDFLETKELHSVKAVTKAELWPQSADRKFKNK